MMFGLALLPLVPIYLSFFKVSKKTQQRQQQGQQQGQQQQQQQQEVLDLRDGAFLIAGAGNTTQKKISLHITTHLSEMRYAYLEHCLPA
jgi:hypothetical protein